MNPQKNYIDERGNYHNVENLTLTQIHDRASEEGYRLGKAEAIAAAEILPEVVEIIRDILPQVVEIAKEKIKKDGQTYNNDLISRAALIKWIDDSVSQYGHIYSTDMLNMWGLFKDYLINIAPKVDSF